MKCWVALPFCVCCMKYTLAAKVLLICLLLSVLPFSMANLNIFRPPQSNQPDCDGWAQKLVGKTLIRNNEESSLSGDQIFHTKDLPRNHRVLPPGGVMTMDYRPERLNVYVDENNKVKSVGLG
ncbi:hypothetical protein BCR43DRAFT_482592 [Syncephalastrum racemosum]|uniref:Peptidase inhibitor I78 family-domain-containing protein n=1 Tax=Syncephalastrum racemosum TaxID=13706 RepID=A0A1X2HU26_SYNRA|nr:hypothetical protein BCR43DRAFT_482592 [Syncephalastrum racemosum]